jgi:hypothetical protein
MPVKDSVDTTGLSIGAIKTSWRVPNAEGLWIVERGDSQNLDQGPAPCTSVIWVGASPAGLLDSVGLAATPDQPIDTVPGCKKG